MTERVWIYVISKELSNEQLQMLSENCKNFVAGWTAHEIKLAASFEIFKKRLLIFKVDESAYNASGCSIDKLQRFVKEQEIHFNIELLNRLLVVYDKNEEPIVIHSSKITELLQSGEITGDTLIYDNTISSSLQWAEWKKPLKNTWLAKYVVNV
ncbi:MAG: hypothetical protein J0L69_10455 [Bacteroidetes bacterium]|nr:hypothetical protein [Bacteroidota bacterium]